MASISDLVARGERALGGLDAIDLATRLTLVLLVLSDWVTSRDPVFQAPLRVLAVAALLLPPMHRKPALWAGISALLWVKTFGHWWTQDNHLFLLTYWTLALALGLSVRETRAKEGAVATSARLLVGLAFLFAALWKGRLSSDFMDGTYFHYAFLTDGRFFDVGYLVGGMTDAAYDHNREVMALLRNPLRAVDEMTLQTTARMQTLALLSAWWTLAIETALALCWLWPRGRGPSKLRDAGLLLFSATTYLIATVETFGWVLLAIGVAQCDRGRVRTRAAYVAVALLVLAYDYVKPLSLLRF